MRLNSAWPAYRGCRGTSRCGLVLASLLLSLLAPVAVQGQAADDSAYREAVESGVRELSLGNHAEAQASFERAHRLSPSARTLRGLGIVAFELKRYVEAERFLQAALTESDEKPLTDAQRKQAESLLRRARSYVGTVHLETIPEEVFLLVDREAVELPRNGTLRLDLGVHQFELSAEGFDTEQRRVTIRGGRVHKLAVSLRPARRNGPVHALSPVSTAATERLADGGGSVFASPWLWTGVGVVAAGAAIVVAVLLSGTVEQSVDGYGGSTNTLLRGPGGE